MGFLKIKTYRNKKLLAVAKEVPECFLCGALNDGGVVMAHSNQGRDGHGMGIKSQDHRIAAICANCHFEIDNGKDLTRMQKIERWEQAHRATMGWLFESGMVDVV